MKRSSTGRHVGRLRLSLAGLTASALILLGCSSDGPAAGAGGAGGNSAGGAGGTAVNPSQGAASGSGGVTSGGAGGRVWPTGTPADDRSFGPRVLVFDAGMAMQNIQSQLDAHFTEQQDNQFGDERYAYFFTPGQYNLDVRVGYYQHVLGVGRSPDDVVITGAVRSNDRSHGSALSNFWRVWENMALVPAPIASNVWAVSQAAPVRRIHVRGSLRLSDVGYSSGGFLADSIVDGNVVSGSQQQWFSRNVAWGGWQGGVFNMVFVGTESAPAGEWPSPPYTKLPTAPVLREKPYLIRNSDGTYAVRLPNLSADASGPSWAMGETPGVDVSTVHFYLARPETDTAATLNARLAEGWNLLFTPGVYELEATVEVTHSETLVLGIGLPTLVTTTATPAMRVTDVGGVILSGLVFDAGPAESPTLLEVGGVGSSADHSANPTSLHDIFCRVGGRTEGTASSCVTINSNHVIADHLWLWRADHGAGATGGQRPGWDHNRSANGLIVNGDNVTTYGLFVEHFQQYQVLWNGDGGRAYFFQSEMPYDPPSQEAWQHDGVRGYAAYKVSDGVAVHEAHGLGVYAIFLSAAVVADNAIETPTTPGVSMNHMVTAWLNGVSGSSIASILNGQGDPVTESNRNATLD